MNIDFKKSFSKDLKKRGNDRELMNWVREVIQETIAANNIFEIKNMKNLKTGGPYYRIRLGDYRIGLIFKDDTITFVRFLHRREIYRYFP